MSRTSDGTPGRRQYEESHPWLDFRLDLRRSPPSLWLLLGEARSKIEHISGALLKPSVAERLHAVFLAKGIHATTALEGNTLTEEQARQLIEGTLRLPQSQEYLAKELENIISAFNAIRDDLLAGGSRDLSVDMISRFNQQVLDGLELEDGVTPGGLRDHSVVVARYRGAPAADCGYLLERMCAWLSGATFAPPDRAWHFPYAILKAIAAHLYLAWIHPFGDGNGRTARLLEVQILLAAGVPTPATHLLSNHYNQTRADYQRFLDAASRTPEGPLAFIEYAIAGFVEGLREQLEVIREQQSDDRWEQYVYETFGHTKSPSEIRRRQLVLDLSKVKRLVPRVEFRTLSPALAEAYAGKTGKTLSRDINALQQLDLIRPRAYRDDRDRRRIAWEPNRKLIEAFLPISTVSETDNSA